MAALESVAYLPFTKEKLAFCAKAGILQSSVSTCGRNQNNFLTDWPKKFQLSQVSFFTGHV